MKIQLIRHATLLIRYRGMRLLVDPMLSPAGTMPPIANSGDTRTNPLVPLPLSPTELIQGVDAVLITHLHRDHFDDMAAEMLPRSLPLFCQPTDADRLRERGFHNIQPVTRRLTWEGVSLVRTGGRHGFGDIGRQMGTVSGFVLRAPGEPTLYLAGDTVWCRSVRDALVTHRPDVVVLNAGGARFVHGRPITMTAEDVARVCREAPTSRVVAVHMEAINHCALTRADLVAFLEGEGLADRVQIPADGETIGANAKENRPLL